MSLKERIYNSLVERRNRILNGQINCIPFPFRRFRADFPGVEKHRYYLVTGSAKSGKTQFTNYVFLYNTIMYMYRHPGKIKAKIFYFPLEETQEDVTLRFMVFLLDYLSEGKIRISPTDLSSTDERKPVDQKVLDFMNTPEFEEIMKIYEDTVTFYDDRHPTGIFMTVKEYAKANGTLHYNEYSVRDEFGKEMVKHTFDYYEPNEPEEYVFVIIDHISLIDTEKGMDLRQSINKLSEYLIVLRNRFHYIPVVVQQQSTETQSLEAFKNNKIRPTIVGLSDSKYPARDCNVLFGLTNPFAFDMPQYLNYDITRLRSFARFMEVIVNRNGQSNGLCPLYFDGAINKFRELPKPGTIELTNLYNEVEALRQRQLSFLSIQKEFNKIAKLGLFSYLRRVFSINKFIS